MLFRGCSCRVAEKYVARVLIGLGLSLCLAPLSPLRAQNDTGNAQSVPSIDSVLDSQLDLAGDNRPQIQVALDTVPETQLATMRFLIENMPANDLQSLSADFLLRHVDLAHKARSEAKWGSQIPDGIFLNEVVPYANVNERRDDVRLQLREKFWPVVRELDSISLAAARLNHEVFKQTGVKYSTKRRRADQGPLESIETGLASCTGLTILLIDTYRACGIPARFVGTPLWSDNSGNHSWVEVWDDGWHFTGAAEPTGVELDKGWFTDRASKATPGKHGIYAVSFKRTDTRFPLVWSRNESTVYAVDVTSHYASNRQPSTLELFEVQFRALTAPKADRCQANLIVKNEAGEVVFRGQTNDETADANNHLLAKLKPGKYLVEFRTAAGQREQTIEVDEDGELITLIAPESK